MHLNDNLLTISKQKTAFFYRKKKKELLAVECDNPKENVM